MTALIRHVISGSAKPSIIISPLSGSDPGGGDPHIGRCYQALGDLFLDNDRSGLPLPYSYPL